MEGVPLASPEPAARPSMARLEITVPEPSLVSEWNADDLHEFHSSSSRVKENRETDMTVPRPFPERIPSRSRRSEPANIRRTYAGRFHIILCVTQVLNLACIAQNNKYLEPPQRGYFPSENVQNTTLPAAPSNGTLELIEVIRSQELEIHKQKKYNEKQYKQLAQQAQVSYFL